MSSAGPEAPVARLVKQHLVQAVVYRAPAVKPCSKACWFGANRASRCCEDASDSISGFALQPELCHLALEVRASCAPGSNTFTARLLLQNSSYPNHYCIPMDVVCNTVICVGVSVPG